MRRPAAVLVIVGPIASGTAAQKPAGDLATPPANARHFVIQSRAGKHGDSWIWVGDTRR